VKNIKIGPKLVVSFLFLAALMAFIGIYLLEGLINLGKHTETIYEKGAVPLGLLIETDDDMQEMRVQIREWWMAKTDEKRAAVLRTIVERHTRLKETIEAQKKLVLTDKGLRALEAMRVSIEKFVAEAYKYIESVKVFDVEGNPKDGGLPESVIAAGHEMTKAVEFAVQTRIGAVKNLSEETLKKSAYHQNVSIVILVVALLLSVVISTFLTFSITRPLNTVVGTLSKIENGDMTVRIGLDRGDELGALSRALDSLSTRLQTIFRNLRQNSDTLAGSAEELSSIGRQVTSATEQVNANINAMASGAEEASANANEVAGTAEQMSTNINTIAAAVEEMSASINQISSNAGEANKIADEATAKSSNATDAMNKLGAAAKEIGQVTDVIKKIADKTNLLALNATIEAASAGEAGKGFAVVAGEIKELANQSATSANDIARRIEGIQIGTGAAVTVIGEVSEIIIKINQSVVGISNHVDQQTKASNEIANNVAQANIGAKRVASAIGEVAKGSKDMARNAGEVAKNSISAQNTKQINQGADELARLASDLKSVLSQFKV